MKLINAALLALLALATASSSSVVQAKADLPPTADLGVAVTYLPDLCESMSKTGDKLYMHYTGRLYTDDTVFDSSRPRNRPFGFKLGAGQVIKGWDEGLSGMCIGEKRELTIPSDLGYGDRGSPPKIPGKATLVFDVELVKIMRDGAEL